MPEFEPSSLHSATVIFSNPKPAGFDYQASLCMGEDWVEMASASFHLNAGQSKGVGFSVTMPSAEGAYPVYFKVSHSGVLIGTFVAKEGVVIKVSYLDEQNLRELEVREAMFREVIETGAPYYDWQAIGQAQMYLTAIELYRTGGPAGEIYKYLTVSAGYIDKPEYYLVGGNVPLMTAETWPGMLDAYRAWCIEVAEGMGFGWSPSQEASLIKFFQTKIIDVVKSKLGKSRLKGWDY